MDGTTKKARKITNGSKRPKKFEKLRKLLSGLENGEIVEAETIWLDGNLRSDTPPVIRCTCGWAVGPESNLLTLGRAAKQHEIETGHLRRSHE